MVTATGPKGVAWSSIKGESGWVLGKGSKPEGNWALKQDAPGSGEGPKLLGFKKCLDKGLNFGWFCVDQGVGLDDPCGCLPTWDILCFCDFSVSYYGVCNLFPNTGH